jgi:hypothetical protein
MYFLIVATFAGGESGSYQLKHYGQWLYWYTRFLC